MAGGGHFLKRGEAGKGGDRREGGKGRRKGREGNGGW